MAPNAARGTTGCIASASPANTAASILAKRGSGGSSPICVRSWSRSVIVISPNARLLRSTDYTRCRLLSLNQIENSCEGQGTGLRITNVPPMECVMILSRRLASLIIVAGFATATPVLAHPRLLVADPAQGATAAKVSKVTLTVARQSG